MDTREMTDTLCFNREQCGRIQEAMVRYAHFLAAEDRISVATLQGGIDPTIKIAVGGIIGQLRDFLEAQDE